MMSGSSLRLTMVNFHCIAKQTRAFASPLMRYVSPDNIQTPANSRFLLRNVRALHTSITRNTDSGQENTTKSHEENGKKLALKDRLKFVVAEYGTTAIVFHVSISLTSLGLCYTAVKSGIDVQAALQSIGVSSTVTESGVATGASTFVVAYACHKVFAPLRMFMTITCTPLIVRKLRKMGILKEPLKQ
ncbi:hypothetical protein OS493_005127 [Desmophyllum pertusum]|uniref:DUF1279 domain-containing protein n=1 Tax=Desmophyllum pertusum TaxID=174260 RepID=A0A9W9Z471_9CNID|nr:hypothetical protein OS493_005127 [Desmophyllum pertusum]